MDWVKERNEECVKALGDPKQTEDYRRILAILDSKDKIPSIHQIGSTETSNVSKVSPRKALTFLLLLLLLLHPIITPSPSVRISLFECGPVPAPMGRDKNCATSPIRACTTISGGTSSMCKASGERRLWNRTRAGHRSGRRCWIWTPFHRRRRTRLRHGCGMGVASWTRVRRGQHVDRAIIKLSPGGSDADTTREMDLAEERFLSPEEGGFALPRAAKTQIAYRSRDEVLVGTDFDGSGESLTDSGYPRVVKSWRARNAHRGRRGRVRSGAGGHRGGSGRTTIAATCTSSSGAA